MKLLGFLPLLGSATALSIRQNTNATSDQARCTLSTFGNVTNVTFVQATYYAANASVNLTSVISTITTTSLPAFCRVEIRVSTSNNNSYANSEVWLPTFSAYTGRFLTIGNGGWAGGIIYQDLGYLGVANGFASVSTNTGHNSTSTGDASWALNNPEALLDFGTNRAVVYTTLAGQRIASQYYGRNSSKNYFDGCSTGGRQALQMVQRFPTLFDGVVAGAPANWWTHLLTWEARVSAMVRPVGSPQWISADLWLVIRDEVLRQCDLLDGVADGVLQDSTICNFRPEAIACRPGQNASTCLNGAQIGALKKIYSPWVDVNQTFVFSGLQWGTEAGNPTGLFGTTEFAIPGGLFNYAIYNGSTAFNSSSITYQSVQLADSIDPGMLNTINPDITSFANRGGRLLQYHGFADQLISPGNSIYYYNSVDQYLRNSSNITTDNVYRLFPVPGMAHCNGGPGANAIGGTGQGALYPVSFTPDRHLLAAMVDWVENSRAPDQLLATRYANNNVSQGVAFTRPLCKFPGVAKYIGGNNTLASSWNCTYPPNATF